MTQILGVTALLLLTYSVPIQAQKKRSPDPPQPEVVRLHANLPTMAVLAETEQSQTKGGLRITLLPEPFKAEVSISTQTRETTPPNRWGFTLRPGPDYVYVEKRNVPRITVSPNRVVLRIQLNNQMPRVFRGAGIAVQFNVAGKTVPVGLENYGALSNIILPPRSEQEITIFGPAIDIIPPASTLGIFFFDVITKMDQAGQITEKQNFEWYFSCQAQAVEREVTILPPERMWVNH